MQNILPISQFGRRLLTVLAVGALLAAALLLQLPTLRGVGASVKTVVLAPCSDAAIQATPADPKAPGTAVTLTAFAAVCGTPEYKFLLLAPGASTWVAKTTYSSTNTYAWNTTGAKDGTWQIGVWVRATGSTATYQAYAIAAYSIVTQYCTSVALGYAAISGVSIDLTIYATPTVCTVPLFEWRELAPGSSTWTTVQPYLNTAGGGASYHLLFPPGLGAHRFVALVKQTGSTHSYDTYQILTVWF